MDCFLPQVCPQAADVVELFIYLGEPCHVCQLLLTISHGADDSTYPSTVDVRTGRNLDSLKLILEVCTGTILHLAPQDFQNFFTLFDFMLVRRFSLHRRIS